MKSPSFFLNRYKYNTPFSPLYEEKILTFFLNKHFINIVKFEIIELSRSYYTSRDHNDR